LNIEKFSEQIKENQEFLDELGQKLLKKNKELAHLKKSTEKKD